MWDINRVNPQEPRSDPLIHLLFDHGVSVCIALQLLNNNETHRVVNSIFSCRGIILKVGRVYCCNLDIPVRLGLWLLSKNHASFGEAGSFVFSVWFEH